MSRYLKALGLALVAAFALSAMAASAASADEFTAAKSSAIVTATQEEHEGVLDVFTTTAGEVECEEAHYAGTATFPTTHITVTPKYDKCFAAGIIPVVVDMNDCGFEFTINPVAGKTEGWVDIECKNSGETITVTVNEDNKTPPTVNLTTKCTIHVTQQTIGGVTYKNIAGGKVTVSVNATGIQYTETAGSGLGACKSTSAGTDAKDGKYKGAAIVEAFEDLGVHGEGTEKTYTEGKAIEISVS